ncbi:hypothetical protein [Streptomyces sp. AA1529]|uniref:hypothetical protein n=1 Tax=Streptomyces sp. AA1529 TaxID=1203257 RepID=UPI000370A3E4|nr:hypothetical protein [Streptomyces sp. AA1529]
MTCSTMLRRRAGGGFVEQIRPGPIIPTDREQGQKPTVVVIHRVLAKHSEHETCPEAGEQAHPGLATSPTAK